MASKLSASIQIVATPAEVFDYTQDYGNRLSWDTFLRFAQLISNVKQRLRDLKSCIEHARVTA